MGKEVYDSCRRDGTSGGLPSPLLPTAQCPKTGGRKGPLSQTHTQCCFILSIPRQPPLFWANKAQAIPLLLRVALLPRTGSSPDCSLPAVRGPSQLHAFCRGSFIFCRGKRLHQLKQGLVSPLDICCQLGEKGFTTFFLTQAPPIFPLVLYQKTPLLTTAGICKELR